MSAVDDQGALDQLVSKIERCRLCVDTPTGKPLPHDPRPVLRVSKTARVAIVGQAPGTRVHASGVPFNDPSGDRLRDWMQVDRETFYDASHLAIIPMGFCFPGLSDKGADLPPRKECRNTWHDQVFNELPQLELLLVIGQYAMAYHIPDLKEKTLTDTVVNWENIYDETRQSNQRPAALVLPHPSWRNNAWLKKHPWFETDLLPVLREKVKQLI